MANRTVQGVSWEEWVIEYQLACMDLPDPHNRADSKLPPVLAWLARVRAEQRLAVQMVRELPLRPWRDWEAACDNEGEVSDGPDA